VEVEYKEKRGTAKFEVEIQWKLGEVEGSKKDKPSLNEVSEQEHSLSDVKKSIKNSFNSIRSIVESGSIPSEKKVSDFIAFSESFNVIAKGEAYEKDMGPYIVMVRKFGEAVKRKNLEEIRSLVEGLRAAKKNCHKTYRWKEV
jgi:XXXCH domain-containing protein